MMGIYGGGVQLVLVVPLAIAGWLGKHFRENPRKSSMDDWGKPIMTKRKPPYTGLGL